MQREQGFTLVEMIMVVVILAIVASIGSNFVISALESYRIAQTRNQLVQRGRLSLEQMARELRMAVPNSVRVSPGGQCVEFLPVVAATHYQSTVADLNNNKSEQTQIAIGNLAGQGGSAQHVVIAPFSPAEIFTAAKPAARVSITSLGPASITLAAPHRFFRNSVNKRLFLTSDPVRFCVSGGNLVRYSDYGFSTTALGGGNPGGKSALMAHDVAANNIAFELSPASQERSMVVRMHLRFSAGTASLDLNHQVLIRNVP